MFKAEEIQKMNDKAYIDGIWVIARPLRFSGIYGLYLRIGDAWKVLTGKADAVEFYKQ